MKDVVRKGNSYRADIDGLRAIAVLSVVIFHIDKNILPGGFVGVDIFFVISGYLISLYIFQQIDRKTFSITEFYRRRIKRIAPAMLAVLIVVIPLSQLILLPDDAKNVAESGIWSLLSMANIYFYSSQDLGYFASTMNEKPLLHFWSLGVEEQFYIIWPIILLFLYRGKYSSLFLYSLIFISLLSFCSAQYFFDVSPSFVYYMLPTRAGELLIGSIVAYLIYQPIRKEYSYSVLNSMSLLGFILIILSLIVISKDSVFPGFICLLPTMGTAFIIFSGHYGTNSLNRYLTFKPLVNIGLISYSTYLWHWPVIAFFRYGLFEQTWLVNIILFCITLVLGWLSFRFIEQPFRYSTLSTKRLFIKLYLVPGASITLLALLFYSLDGYGVRWFSPQYQTKLTSINTDVKAAYHYKYVCQRSRIDIKDIENTHCILGNKTNNESGSTTPQIILIGDSNAAHYVGMIGAFAKEQGFSFRNLQISACPPVKNSIKQYVNIKHFKNCRDSLKLLWQYLEQFRVIIISASWLSYQLKSDGFLVDFYQTVKQLIKQGKQVILIGKAPIISSYNQSCLSRSLSFPFVNCYKPSILMDKNISSINLSLKTFSVENENVDYFDANDFICRNKNCSAFSLNGEAIYFDKSHLSIPGSWKLGREIIKYEGVPYPFNVLNEL